MMSGIIIIKKESLRIFLASFIAIASTLTAYNRPLAAALIAIESLFLLHALLSRNYTRYTCFYLMFMVFSIEFSMTSESVLSFKECRLFGLNLGIWFGIPIIVKALENAVGIYAYVRTNKKLNFYYIVFILIILSSTLWGCVGFALNINNVQSMSGSFRALIGEFLQCAVYPLIAFCAVLVNFGDTAEIKSTLFSMLAAFPISTIASFILGIKSIYGGVDTLLVCTSTIFLPFMLLVIEGERKKRWLVLYVIGSFLTLFYNASGKAVLLFCICIGIYLFMLLRRGKHLKLLVVVLAFLLVAIFLSPVIIQQLSQSVLFRSKLLQASELLNIFNKNWFAALPYSPRQRVAEFINIWAEYKKMPLLILFGKGYLGTIQDNLGLFIYQAGGTFSDAEWASGCYYALHETPNMIFLQNGLQGLAIYFCVAKDAIQNFHRSSWFFIGCAWFLLFYGYSCTLARAVG